MKWKMEWKGHCTQWHLTRVAGTVQPSLSYLLWVLGYYHPVKAIWAGRVLLGYFLVWYNDVTVRKWGSLNWHPLDPYAANKVMTSYSIMHGAHTCVNWRLLPCKVLRSSYRSDRVSWGSNSRDWRSKCTKFWHHTVVYKKKSITLQDSLP